MANIDQILNPITTLTDTSKLYVGNDGVDATIDWGSLKPLILAEVESVYDPTGKQADAFSMDNMDETATKKVLTDIERASIVSAEQTANKSAANGYASLDGGGKVPVSELPSSVVGGIKVVGSWNANTNTPDLSLLSLSAGEAYMVSVAGSTNLNGETNWKVKDLAVWDDSLAGNWFKMDNTDDVISVNSKTGVVVLDTGDVNEVTDKNYVTDAESVVIGNTSNTNTGDQDLSSLTSAASNIADNAIVRGDGGVKGVQSSGVAISDTNNITGINNITANTYKGKFDWHFNFQDVQEQDNIVVNYALTIDTVTNLVGAPTTTITVNALAYVLGNPIAAKDVIKVVASVASNIDLNITRT